MIYVAGFDRCMFQDCEGIRVFWKSEICVLIAQDTTKFLQDYDPHHNIH